VMVTCVILVAIVIAGAEYLYKTQAILTSQKNRRIALWVANSSLENMRASAYTNSPVGTSTGTVYIGNTSRKIITKIEDGSGSSPSACRRVTVSVGYYGDSTNTDRVTVVTSRSPYSDTF
jgi:Tfp pilus assembly protein PilV